MIAAERSRIKARLWHKQVAKLLRDTMPALDGPSSRTCADDDLEGASDLEVPVFWVASRSGQLPGVRRALRDAQLNAPAGRLPLAVIKDEGHNQAFVAMPLDAFLLLVSGWWAATQPVAITSKPASSEQRSE
jgi:hypothetical protein